MTTPKNFFRKSALDQVTSPEQLNDYIKISRPSIWLTLTAIVILLTGVLTWSAVGTLTTVRKAVAVVTDGKTTCYIAAKEGSSLTTDMPVHIGDSTGSITDITTNPVEITEDFDTYALYVGEFNAGDWVVPISVDINVPDGVYPADIVLESISPISFILN